MSTVRTVVVIHRPEARVERASWEPKSTVPFSVMAGLVPAIHVFLNGISAKKDVDHRDKPGDDEESGATPRSSQTAAIRHSRTFIRHPEAAAHGAALEGRRPILEKNRPFILRGAQERAPQDDGMEVQRVSWQSRPPVTLSVIAGLDPAIHSSLAATAAKMDHRVKPGDDAERVGAPRPSLLAAPHQDQTLSPHGEERPLGRVSNHEARAPWPHPSRRRRRLLLRTMREGWS
jgi:hypothetical protein